MKKKWLEFLNQWRDAVETSVFAQDINVSEWVEREGATEAQITETEARLRVSLPPSYRAFLKASDGLAIPGNIVPELLPVEEIDLLRVLDPEMISAWKLGVALYGSVQTVPDEEYFVYGKEQDSSNLRSEYLETALQVSGKESADTSIYLLNPQVIDEEGEWEAWSFAHWKAGADRYRSFWDLMQAEYRNFQMAAEQEEKRPQPGDEPGMLLVKLPDLIDELHEKAAIWEKMLERDNERGSLLELGYHQGILEGLQYAERRVREIGARETGPEKLYAQLKALANDLQEKWQAGVKKVKRPNMRDLLFGGANQSVYLSGTAEGYREAWGIVNWFIHDG